MKLMKPDVTASTPSNTDSASSLADHSDVGKLPSHIRRSIQCEPDPYQQLITLLSPHPVVVLPHLLLHYHSNLPDIDQPELSQLLRALIFHNKWNAFWSIQLTTSNTLSDIEDSVDMIYDQLHINNNSFYGVWLALYTASSLASSSSLAASISEHLLYRFSLQASSVASFLSFASHLDAVYSFDSLHELRSRHSHLIEASPLYSAFILRHSLKLLHDTPSTAENDLLLLALHMRSDRRLLKHPGWLSFILLRPPWMQLEDSAEISAEIPAESETSTDSDPPADPPTDSDPSAKLAALIKQHVLHHRLAALNDLDYLALFPCCTPKDAPALFHSAIKDYKRGFLACPAVINHIVHLAAINGNTSLLHQVCEKFNKNISTLQWQRMFPTLLQTTQGQCIVKKLARKNLQTFRHVTDHVIPSLPIPDLLSLVLCAANDRLVVRNALKYVTRDKFSLPDLSQALRRLSVAPFTVYNMMEIFRFAVRENIIDESTCRVFQNVLSKTWNRSRLLQRDSSGKSLRFQDDFQLLYSLASKKDRQNLPFNIWSMAHAISHAPPPLIAHVLNSIHHFIYDSNDFHFVSSSHGKKYIFDRLLSRTLHFIYTRQPAPSGLNLLRQVVSKLNFDSKVAQACLFEYIVQENPLAAFEMAKAYNEKGVFLNKSLLEGIHKGILRSPKSSPLQKLHLVDNFTQLLLLMGYNYKLSAKTTALYLLCLFDKTIDIPLERSQLEHGLKLAYERKLPLSLIKNWATQVRIRKR